MEILQDNDLCTNCGTCIDSCIQNNFIRKGNSVVKNEDGLECIECLQCMVACPQQAIKTDLSSIEVLDSYNNELPTETLSRFMLTKKSCRSYSNKEINQDDIKKLVEISNVSARMISYTDRKFIFLTDPEEIDKVRQAILQSLKKAVNMFKVLKLISLTKTARKHYNGYYQFFSGMIKKSETKDALFHGAPALIMIYGPKKNVGYREDGMFPLSHFLLLTHSIGLGSCYNGYISGFAKAITKVLNLPGDQLIYQGAIVGYPKLTYRNPVLRNDVKLSFNLNDI